MSTPSLPPASVVFDPLDRSTRPGSDGDNGPQGSSIREVVSSSTAVVLDLTGRSAVPGTNHTVYCLIGFSGTEDVERRTDAPGNPFSWVPWRWSLVLRVL
jgi:hypothetical protein